MKTGRNAPCPCGSGKKYKRCCLPADEAAFLSPPILSSDTDTDAVTDPVPFDDQDAEPAPGLPPPGDVMSLDYWREMQKKLPRKERGLVQPIIRTLEQSQSRQRPIEDAVRAIREHWDEVQAMQADQDAATDRLKALFSEPPFEDMRISPDDLNRAFDELGYPGECQTSEEQLALCKKTIAFLAEGEACRQWGQRLMNLLPEYVAAERYLDAALILENAVMLGDEYEPEDEDGLPLLVTGRFFDAFRDWQKEQDQELQALYAAIGLDSDTFNAMKQKDVLARINAARNDPQMTAAMHAYVEQHPHLKARMAAQTERNETRALALLRREDILTLLVPPEAIEPWANTLRQRFENSAAIVASTDAGETPPESVVNEASQLFVEVAEEMADRIFTPARRQDLVDRLHGYIDQWPEDDAEGKQSALAAVIEIQSRSTPRESHFLVSACYTSMLAWTRILE